ncbi:MAG: response regulator, partial [Desulfovibrio sp.]|jgi:CheY-like chemotaxis protein|nr:response regulator [Desulfovibrio sp.]
VLLVDDFPSNLMVAEGLLMPYRMRVHTCLNGREAVELVRERPFDLVLMDHMMPEMDGVEATHAIRTMEEGRCRAMPVIALTANAVSGMKEMFLENGFNDFLSKPIDASRLDAVLRKWIPAGKRRDGPDGQDGPDGGGNAPAASPEIAFPDIAGLDVAAGITTVGGSQARYRDLLDMFHRDSLACLPLLEQSPENADLKIFTTQVHALKSALANIGANGLSQEAALLEQAGREGNMPTIREKLAPFREELAALAARIGEVPASARSGDGAEQRDSAIEEALARLRDALEAKDIDGIDAALARLRALPLAGETGGAVAEIVDCILTMDFQKAANRIASLLA